MRYGLDLAHIKDAQIGLPAMNLKQRVVIAAELLRQSGRTRDYLIEHSAERRTIDRPWLHGKADDAAGELIHHNHHPVRLEDQRFTTKQIETSKAVFGASEERGPGRPVGAAGRPTVFSEYTSHNILIDLDTEYEGGSSK